MSNVNAKSSKLTDTQLVMLSKAAQRDDAVVEAPPHLRGSAVAKVLTGLEGRGLIMAKTGAEDEAANDGPGGYILTPAAFAALGIAPPAMMAEQAGDTATADASPVDGILPNAASVDAASAGVTSADGAMAEGTAAHEVSAKAPRSGTKLASVMTALDRPEGASLAALMELTGWLAHTTRAALTGLRHRDLIIDRSRNTEGVTIYRLMRALPSATASTPIDDQAKAA